jgi:type IV secretion system protein VirB10
MSEDAREAPAPQKADPETLVLRGAPGRVVRFRRAAVIAIAALCSTAVAGITWVALQPVAFRMAAHDDDQSGGGAKLPGDVLANAPKSYAEVPQLGPPLPGDLGRPILEHQRALGAAAVPSGADQAAQAAEADRQRVEAERKAARESAIMIQVSGSAGQAPVAPTEASSAVPADRTPTASMIVDGERDPNGQRRKTEFVSSKPGAGDLNPHGLAQAASPWTLQAGSVIAAALITGLNSDLPGLVTAQVTENAYDSVTGKILLLPRGSRLIGSYDSVVAFGQKRALVVWQRIILPDGSSIRIDDMPASDTAGYAGLTDRVDLHTWQLLKGVALSTLLGVGTELSFGSSESDLVRALRESTQQSSARAGDQLVMKNLNVQPTLRVRPGWPVRVIVNKDIVLRPWPGGA